jgi:hypothetical protein
MGMKWQRIVAGVYHSGDYRVQVRNLDDPNCREWIILTREPIKPFAGVTPWDPWDDVFPTMREAREVAESAARTLVGSLP